MIDAHAHLIDPRLLPEADRVIAQMQEAGVVGVLVIGYDVATSAAAVDLARRYPDLLRVAIGMHPHDSRLLDEEALQTLRTLAREPEVVAWGEIGLDYHYDYSPRPIQREAFRRQLAEAASAGLPIVIHEREAVEDVLEILNEEVGETWHGAWHCCSVDPSFVAEIATRFFVGIAGWITFPKSENIREIARLVPEARLLVETDAPYLTPVPYRGKTNEPANVVLVAEALARERGISVSEVERFTTENTYAAFPRWTKVKEEADGR